MIYYGQELLGHVHELQDVTSKASRDQAFRLDSEETR
jgi:hypothetical protein